MQLKNKIKEKFISSLKASLFIFILSFCFFPLRSNEVKAYDGIIVEEQGYNELEQWYFKIKNDSSYDYYINSKHPTNTFFSKTEGISEPYVGAVYSVEYSGGTCTTNPEGETLYLEPGDDCIVKVTEARICEPGWTQECTLIGQYGSTTAITKDVVDAEFGGNYFENNASTIGYNYQWACVGNGCSWQWHEVSNGIGGFASSTRNLMFEVYPSGPASGTTTIVNQGDVNFTGFYSSFIPPTNSQSIAYGWQIRAVSESYTYDILTLDFGMSTNADHSFYAGIMSLPNGTYTIQYFRKDMGLILSLSTSTEWVWSNEQATTSYALPDNYSALASTTLVITNSIYAHTISTPFLPPPPKGWWLSWGQDLLGGFITPIDERVPLNYIIPFFTFIQSLDIPTTITSTAINFEIKNPITNETEQIPIDFSPYTTSSIVLGTETKTLKDWLYLFSELASVGAILVMSVMFLRSIFTKQDNFSDEEIKLLFSSKR